MAVADQNSVPAPVPGLKWHENGRYLTKEQCLAHVADIRGQMGRSQVINEDEQALSLEACHELLTRETDARFEQVADGLKRSLPGSEPSLKRSIVWLLIAVVGISAPYWATWSATPSWLVWLAKGSGGEGQGWQLLGGLAVAVGAIELLRWGGERFQSPLLGHASVLAWRLLMAGMLLVGVAFVGLLGSLLISVLASGIADLLPSPFATVLRSLDRGVGPVAIGVVLIISMVASLAIVYRKNRQVDPDGAVIDALGSAAFSAFEPYYLLALIALKSLVWFGMIIIAMTYWFPVVSGEWATWIDANRRSLVSFAMVVSLVSPFAIHAWHHARVPEGGSAPRFGDSCWTVNYVLLGLGGLVIVLALVAAGIKALH